MLSRPRTGPCAIFDGYRKWGGEVSSTERKGKLWPLHVIVFAAAREPYSKVRAARSGSQAGSCANFQKNDMNLEVFVCAT